MFRFTVGLALILATPAPAAILTVTSSDDTAGASCAATCTLRQAITAANASVGSDVIRFSVSAGGEVLIQPATPLPVITQPLVIDGYSQPDSAVNTASAGSNAVLRVRLHGAAIASAGVAGLSGCAASVLIQGLSITGFTSSGSAAIRAGGSGCATATQVSVLGNFIGLRTNGSTADGNATGVEANGARVIVGGNTLADRNVIAQTTQDAVLLLNAGASGSSVFNNLIGSDRSGSVARPVNRGVNLGLAVSNANIGSVDLPNVITNAGSGVGILVSSGSNNTVAFNRFAAISSPIDLAAAGGVVTANDLNDADSGPNGLQNFPVIQSVQRISGGLRVQGTLDVPVATNNLPYILSFYASSSCAASGNGAGERFLGNFQAFFTQGSGETFSIDVLTQDLLPAGTQLTAAATGTEGSSELSACAAVPGGSAGFVVTTVGNSSTGACAGSCTLAQAIAAANARAGADTIGFHLLGAGPHQIGAGALPALRSDLTIDGYTQPGASVNTDPVNSNAQLKVELRSDTTLAGLFTCGSHITVRGLSLTGIQTLAMKFDPTTFNCAIAGTDVRVLGNFIGLTPNGAAGPAGTGISVQDTIAVIGSALPADRNVVGGRSVGVFAAGAVSGSTIQGNLIGTDPSGLVARANGFGVQLQGGAAGVVVGGSGAQANLIANNDTGVVLMGTAGVGNSLFGNHYAGNDALGIDLSLQGAQVDGVSANDGDDGDSGPNQLQNFPLLTSVVPVGNELQIAGQLDVPTATSNASYTLAIYESASCDASGNGEGQTFLGTETVVLSGGAESFAISLPLPLNPQALQFSATATDANGNTSEFSACRLASALPEIIFQSRFE